MRVWIAMNYEPLPGVDGDARLLRCGTLARALVSRGHDVVWWTGTLDHARKRQRFHRDTVVHPEPGLEIRLLHARGYQSNVSLQRLYYHRAVARSFERAARATQALPDVIFACIPTPDLAARAVEFGRSVGVPVVVDAQDRWPDLLLTRVPPSLRFAARGVLRPLFRRTSRALSDASRIVAVSNTYLDWALKYAGRPRGPKDAVFFLGCSRPDIDDATLAEAWRRLREAHGIPGNKLLVTYMGQFGQSYDLETVVAAARALHERGRHEVHFALAGAGDRDADLRSQAVGLPNVSFTGWLDRVASFALLRQSAAGLAAYVSDAPQSLPYKPFDYMAASLPIVSSLAGEFSELVRRYQLGVEYRSGNAASLADAVARLADDPASLARMRPAVEQAFVTTFSNAVIYPRLVDFIEHAALEATSRAA